ncbi:FAD binding domain-containing protein [Candidatus Eisenbacteria bacterium]|uniref:FAD binding domain-containing protein n=1 Tax=Eiseniibacteriota bacterium TaxID=2212470 RepID=A0ABV6YI71_UNCEI
MPGVEFYAAPTSLEEAVQRLAEGNGSLYAGGTDLLPQIRSGAKVFERLLLNIRRVPELTGVLRTNGTIRIGALSTVTDILKDSLLQESATILPEVADCFACGQVRNSATIGGNICNASPAGDMIIPLLLLDAEVELASWTDGALTKRCMPLSDFFVGPGKTRILPTEILTAVKFAAPAAGFVAGFRKFGARPAMDISVVSVGVSATLAENTLRNTRVAFGAVAPVPLRGRETEAALEGKSLQKTVVTEATHTAREEVSPISDVRASAWYRKELVGVLTERLLTHVNQSAD